MKENEFKHLTIILTVKNISFIGKYRRDLEKPNWHYYETVEGKIFHFRKDQMVGVLENVYNDDGDDFFSILK